MCLIRSNYIMQETSAKPRTLSELLILEDLNRQQIEKALGQAEPHVCLKNGARLMDVYVVINNVRVYILQDYDITNCAPECVLRFNSDITIGLEDIFVSLKIILNKRAGCRAFVNCLNYDSTSKPDHTPNPIKGLDVTIEQLAAYSELELLTYLNYYYSGSIIVERNEEGFSIQLWILVADKEIMIPLEYDEQRQGSQLQAKPLKIGDHEIAVYVRNNCVYYADQPGTYTVEFKSLQQITDKDYLLNSWKSLETNEQRVHFLNRYYSQFLILESDPKKKEVTFEILLDGKTINILSKVDCSLLNNPILTTCLIEGKVVRVWIYIQSKNTQALSNPQNYKLEFELATPERINE